VWPLSPTFCWRLTPGGRQLPAAACSRTESVTGQKDRRLEVIPLLLQLQRECGGVIPAERFIEEALYHPRLGYYSATIREVGKEGDFSTSATLDPSLAVAIAGWIRDRAAAREWTSVPVIECGAGSGELARRILQALDPHTRRRLRYTICETSPNLRNIQKRKLFWKGVRWETSVAAALDHHRGKALIFSNELVDAFPCRVFQKGPTGWRELGIRISAAGSLEEIPIGSSLKEEWFSCFEALPEGQRVERHDSYGFWQRAWSPFWKEGSMLTIDYGDLAQNLYPSRVRGTLRAYWKHRCMEGLQVYARFGLQDITADVNFSDLLTAGDALGWRTRTFSTQGEFLSGNSRLGEQAASAFKVLEQEIG
jgi:SAM-dependent MidA family methyltransferase